jgi:hypothetical protein
MAVGVTLRSVPRPCSPSTAKTATSATAAPVSPSRAGRRMGSSGAPAPPYCYPATCAGAAAGEVAVRAIAEALRFAAPADGLAGGGAPPHPTGTDWRRLAATVISYGATGLSFSYRFTPWLMAAPDSCPGGPCAGSAACRRRGAGPPGTRPARRRVRPGPLRSAGAAGGGPLPGAGQAAWGCRPAGRSGAGGRCPPG